VVRTALVGPLRRQLASRRTPARERSARTAGFPVRAAAPANRTRATAAKKQKSSGVKPFVQITQGLKPYMGQQVSSFQGRFAEWRLRRLGAT